MKFNTAFDHPARGKPLGACPKTQVNFRRLPNGELERCADVQQYEKTQSYKEELSVERILLRSGFINSDCLPDSAFIDTVDLPRDFAEVQSLRCQVRNQFEQLPEALRNYFGSAEKFMDSVQSGNFSTVLESYFKATAGAAGTTGAGTTGAATTGAGTTGAGTTGAAPSGTAGSVSTSEGGSGS